MEIKSFLYGVFSTLLLVLIMASFGFAHLGAVNSVSGNLISDASSGDYANIPEKCRPPAGEDITSWKEHLGHHSETKDCLKYFN